MRVHILFGQRQQKYQGQYAPEALAVMDEYGYEENPTWIQDMFDSNKATGDFEALDIIVVEIPTYEIQKRLHPATEPISATIVEG
jgi:hypothetical protein